MTETHVQREWTLLTQKGEVSLGSLGETAVLLEDNKTGIQGCQDIGEEEEELQGEFTTGV